MKKIYNIIVQLLTVARELFFSKGTESAVVLSASGALFPTYVNLMKKLYNCSNLTVLLCTTFFSCYSRHVDGIKCKFTGKFLAIHVWVFDQSWLVSR